jgi:hypothetical protein
MKNSRIARVDADFYRKAKKKAEDNNLSLTDLTSKLIPDMEAMSLEAGDKLGLKRPGRRKQWI